MDITPVAIQRENSDDELEESTLGDTSRPLTCTCTCAFLNDMLTEAESSQNKAKKRRINGDGALERNLAIANYYDAKCEKVKLEIELLKLELENKINNN